MTKTKPTLGDCNGCFNDFYNHNRMGLNEADGAPQCWSFKTATMVNALDVPVDMPPPYLRLKPTLRPSCYKRQRYVRVKRESLTKDGYWR